MRTDPEHKHRNVFISHADGDRAVASALREALLGAGLQVWWDTQLDAGRPWTEQIVKSIRSADTLLILVSREMLKSAWAQQELYSPLITRDLEDRAITVVPILLEDCELPSALSGKFWLDLRGERKGAIKHLVAQLEATPRVDLAQLTAGTLESMVVDLLEALGLHNVRLVASDSGRDLGYDIEAMVGKKDPFDSTPTRRWLIQVKHVRDDRISINLLKQLIAMVIPEPLSTGVALITSARLTSVARDFVSSEGVRSGHAVRVIEGPQLAALVLNKPSVTAKYFRCRRGLCGNWLSGVSPAGW